MGRREVTAIGMVSVIHQMDTQSVQARMDVPSGLSPSGLIKNCIKIKARGPEMSPGNFMDFLAEVIFIIQL